ncbi:MAG: hypothetical protein D6785_15190, partial [Planctomycetota bacterium]
MPHLKDSLISAVQLSQKKSPYVSQALQEATIEEGNRKLEALSHGKILPFKLLLPSFFLTIVILVLSCLPYLLKYESPYLYRIFWLRFAALADASWPKEVELDIQIEGSYLKELNHFEYALPEGAEIKILAKARRGNPKEVILVMDRTSLMKQTQKDPSKKKSQRGAFKPIVLKFQKISTNLYTLTMKPQKTFVFRIQGGDFRSPPYKINIQHYPDIASIRYKRKYPQYLGIPEDRHWYLWNQIEIFWGSELMFQVTTTKPIQKAWLRINNKVYYGKGLTIMNREDGTAILEGRIFAEEGSLLPLGMIEDEALSAQIQKNKNGNKENENKKDRYRCSFILEDMDGMSNPHPQEFEILIKRDLPPQIQIHHPLQTLEITSKGKIPLRFSVVDDYGIQKVWLIVSV